MTIAKLLIVDISSVFRTCWEATDGKTAGAARDRALDMINRAIDQSGRADRVAVACDRGGIPCRATFDPKYKASRKDPGEAYRGQLEYLLDRLACDGHTVWLAPKAGTVERDGKEVPTYFEGDDVVAGLVQWWDAQAPDDNAWCRIMTADHDLWSLVDDESCVSVLSLKGDTVTVDTVVQRYGVNPSALVWVKAIAGDSDGFKPYKGVGPETAAKLVRACTQGQTPVDLIRVIVESHERGEKINGVIGLPANMLQAFVAGGIDAAERGFRCASLYPVLSGSAILRPPHGHGSPALASYDVIADEPRILQITEVPPPQAKPAAPPSAATQDIPADRAIAPAARGLPVRSGLDPYALEPQTDEAAIMFAKIITDGRLFQKTIQTWQAALTAISWGRTMGFSAVVSLANFFTIHGQPGWSAAAKTAAVKNDERCEILYACLPKCTRERAVIRYKRKDQDTVDGGPYDEYVFTIEDAKRAGFLDGKHSEQWAKNPRVMLIWAALREVTRLVWMDVLLGVYTPDEIRSGDSDPGDELPAEIIDP